MSETSSGPPVAGFCHQASLYRDDDEFMRGIERFVLGGLRAGDALAVLIRGRELEALRTRLGSLARRVRLTETDELADNPAWVIPFWQEFRESLGVGQRGRAVSEPISVAAGSPVSAEYQLHESLVNLAFSRDSSLWLLCPYHSDRLDERTLDGVYRCHPFVGIGEGACRPNDRFVSDGSPLTGDLQLAPADAHHRVVDANSIASARQVMAELAVDFGLDTSTAADFALAAHEVIANSVRHGGGRADVAVWHDDDDVLICEVRDRGRFEDPLAGRMLPGERAKRGRGLWMANRLCQLVQIRSADEGTVVRLHMRQRP